MYTAMTPRAGRTGQGVLLVSALADLIAEQLEPGCRILCLTDVSVAKELSALLPQHRVAVLPWQDEARCIFGSVQGDIDAPTHPLPCGEDGTYDVVVLQRTLRFQASPLPVLSAAHTLLVPKGNLYIFSGHKSPAKHAPLSSRQLEYLSAIAKHAGFFVELSSSSTFKATGGGLLLACRKPAGASRWTLGHLIDEDLAEFQTVFRDSFGSDLSTEVWAWKYGGGRGQAVVARRDNRLVAHYGSMTRAISFFGKPGIGLEICDVMVDPRERGVFTKKGAMFLIAATYLEIYLGLLGNTLAYGFPTRRHMLLAERLGLYAEVAQMVEVRWAAKLCRREDVRSDVLIGQEDSERHRIDRLWKRMKRDLRDAIVVVRDWEYIKYRYFDHPQRDYLVLYVRKRLSRRAIGVIVLRREVDQCELVDIIAPLRSLGTLVEEARSVAARLGFPSVYCWITRHEAWRFSVQEGSVKPLDISVPTNIWVDGPAVEQLTEKWWLMSGDTDFR